jgi:hypothetical protein
MVKSTSGSEYFAVKDAGKMKEEAILMENGNLNVL